MPDGRSVSARTGKARVGGDSLDVEGLKSLPSNHNMRTLPPLKKNAKGAWEESIEGVPQEWSNGVSPARQARKQGLAVHINTQSQYHMHDQTHNSVVAASLEVDVREKEMSLSQDNRHATKKLMMELWVNQVLDPGTKDLTGIKEPLQVNVAMLQGLAKFGLTRVELMGAGLTDAAVDRVYRALYVYSIGFFDIMQETFQHSEFRLELLSSVWQAFLYIAEAALKVAFKSDYLRIFQAQQLSAAELLIAKEALAEARQDSYNTEKALAWLTAAHSEERALRQSLKLEVETTQGHLVREQRAHQAAVVKFLAEMESRNKLQLDYNKLMDQLNAAALAQADLIAQRDAYKSDHDFMTSKCNHVLKDVNDSYEALTMDGELQAPEELMAVVRREEAKEEKGHGTRLTTLESKSTAVRYLTIEAYNAWRQERKAHQDTQSEVFSTKDALRDAKSQAIEYKAERDAAYSGQRGALAEVKAAKNEIWELDQQLKECQRALKEMTSKQDNSLYEIDRLKRHGQGLETMLEAMTLERNKLDHTSKRQAGEITELTTNLATMTDKQANTEWHRNEISKALSITMRSLWANQVGRNHLQEVTKKAREKILSLTGQLDASNRDFRVQTNRLTDMTTERNELTMALEAANKQVQQLQAESLEVNGKLEEQATLIEELEKQLKDAQKEISELDYSDKKNKRLLGAAEEALAFEKDEVTRLYTSMQELEAQLMQNAEERRQLIQKVEQAQAETSAGNDKFKRREETLDLEIKRLQSEAKVQNACITSLEVSLNASRKKMDEAMDLLERKRGKKRRWKQIGTDRTREVSTLRQALGTRDEVLTHLALRLQPLQIDLAILMADRGRNAPKYTIPEGGFQVAVEQLEKERAEAEGQNSDPAEQLSTTGEASGEQSASPEVETDGAGPEASTTGQGESTTAAVGPTFGDPPDLKDMGINPENLHDITEVERAWDDTNQRALTAQMRLHECNEVLSTARKAYERSRAIFYQNPTDPALQSKVDTREQELDVARASRTEAEQELLKVTNEMRKLQKRLDEYEFHQAENRMAEVKWRVGLTEIHSRTEHSARVDDAQERCDRLTKLLQEQRVAYDMLKSSFNSLEGECGSTEQELKKLSAKLSQMVVEKMEIEDQLQQTRAKVLSLQGKVGDLSDEHDRQSGEDEALKYEIRQMQQQLQAATQDVTSTVKRLEKTFADERARLLADAEEERIELEHRMDDLRKHIKVLEKSESELQNQMRAVLLTIHDDLEQSPKPKFLHVCRPRPIIMHAENLVPNFSKVSNFAFKDPVVAFISPTFESTLVLISQIFTAKMLLDCQMDESLLGGAVGKRAELESVTYDFFTQRYGVRPAAEMHLAAFLNSVSKYKNQHAKIRVFSRLLGLDDPLPPIAMEFYSALLNRVHARAGPLDGEASEGVSQVKCKVIAKACRELLRGSYSVANEDAANLSDTLRRWAGNNEEQPIDLEVCLEVALKAWCKQHTVDAEALTSSFNEVIDGRSDVTPDDFAAFVKRLEPMRPDAHDPALLTRMYRTAARKSGAHPSVYDMMEALASLLLEEGFVGMDTRIQWEP